MNEKINKSKDMQPILDAMLEVSKENMKNLILDSACQKQEIYKMIEEILERELAKFSNAMKAMLEAKSREFSEKIAFMEARDAQRIREMETMGNGDYEKRDGKALANSEKLCECDREPAPDFGLCKSIYEASKIILEIISGITRRKYTPFPKLMINILRGIFEAFGVKPPDILVKIPAQTAVSREKTEEEKINDGIAFICSKIENKRTDDKYMVDFVAKFSVRNNIPIAEMVKELDMRDSESVLKSFERYKGAYEDRIYGYGPER